MKKIASAVLCLLLALIPTYFIIYNTVTSTGLPLMESVREVGIVTPKGEHRTYYAESDMFYLIFGVLKALKKEDALPNDVSTDSSYSLTFTTGNGNETTARIYASTEKLMAYLVTPQNRVYSLPYFTGVLGFKSLSPAFVRFSYAVTVDKSAESPIFTSPKETYYAVNDFSELASAAFPGAESVKKPVYYVAGEPCEECNADTAYIFVEYALSENTSVQVAYCFCRK